MNVEAKKIVSRTTVYGFGTVIRGLTSFLMLPIYTHYLRPDDYGLIEMLTMVVDLAALLFGARIATAVFRFYHRANTQDDKKLVISTSIYITFALNALCVISLLFVSPIIADFVLGSREHWTAIAVFSATLIFGSITEVCLGYVRIIDRPFLYVGTSLLKLVMQLSLNVYFLVIVGLTYWGVIFSAVISGAILTIFIGTFVIRHNGFRFDKKLIRPLVSYSLPIVLTSIGMFFITFGDRFFLKFYQGIEAVGIYSLGYKFGVMLFSLVWTPFLTYWEARQFEVLHQEGGVRTIATVFRYVSLMIAFVALCLSLLAPEIVYVMASSDYRNAAGIVPFIAFAYVFQAWTSYVRVGLLFTGETKYLAMATYITLALIALLYYFSIPHYGIYGAAISTVVAMFVRLAMIAYWSQKKLQVPYENSYNYLFLIFSILLLGSMWGWEISLQNFLIKLLVLMVVPALLFFSPFIDENTRKKVISLISYRFKLMEKQ